MFQIGLMQSSGMWEYKFTVDRVGGVFHATILIIRTEKNKW